VKKITSLVLAALYIITALSAGSVQAAEEGNKLCDAFCRSVSPDNKPGMPTVYCPKGPGWIEVSSGFLGLWKKKVTLPWMQLGPFGRPLHCYSSGSPPFEDGVDIGKILDQQCGKREVIDCQVPDAVRELLQPHP
jgi:hypothetical protein